MAGNGFEISFYNDETGQWEVTPTPSAKPLAVRKQSAKATQKRRFEAKRAERLRANEAATANIDKLGSGIASIPSRVVNYIKSSTPSSVGRDVKGIATATLDAAVEDPNAFIEDAIFSPLAAIRDFGDVRETARKLRAQGRDAEAEKMEAMAGTAILSAVPILGRPAGVATRKAIKAAEKSAIKGATKIATKKKAAAKSSLSVKTVPPERGSTAYGTYELAPGVMTRHRQDVLGDEALREQFSLDPATSWQTSEGTDTLYDVLGIPQSPTVRMTGIYEPDVPGAALESNIGFAARPRLEIGPDGNPLPDQYNAMSGAEAVRAVADTQGAGAWSMPILPKDLEQAGALFIPTGSPTDIQRLLELRERGAKYGLPDVGDLGEGVMLTNFGGLPLGSETMRALRQPMSLGQGNLGADIRRILGSSTRPEQIGTTGDYIGLEDAWMQPEGSGAVSEALRGYLDQMTPKYREAMLEDPRVAEQFGRRFLRDEEARRAGVPVREDVQRAREAIAEQERLQALFDLIARGRPAMAQGGLVAAGG